MGQYAPMIIRPQSQDKACFQCLNHSWQSIDCIFIWISVLYLCGWQEDRWLHVLESPALHIWACFHPQGGGPPWITHWHDSDLQSCYILHPDQLKDWQQGYPDKAATMVVVEMKEMKEPFTVLRPEEFLENNRYFHLLLPFLFLE